MASTLLRRLHPLATAANQVSMLESPASSQPYFASSVQEHVDGGLTAANLDTMQVNLGKLCNQTCSHCHVDAGPERREVMARATMEDCLDVIRRVGIANVDLTGGAPEMNPHFRWLVAELKDTGCRIIDRCNLTILSSPGFEDLAAFLAANHVEVVASLPCYLESNTDRQRGDGVFAKSIAALKRLNALGYGYHDTSLVLSLVYNPIGPQLPPNQAELEAAYRRELLQRHGLSFTRLYTITNMPISRFLAELQQSGRYDEYMQRLIDSFNPHTLDGLMCRRMVSVDWQGYLFDCDFNQMLDLPIGGVQRTHIRDLDDEKLQQLRSRAIVVGRHCFGCTAGSGSSCQGAVAN